MDATSRAELWQQIGAALDMLERAIVACPDNLWGDRSRRPEFWYLAFHTLFFADLCFFGRLDGFLPPPPFTLNELEEAGIVGPYTKEEVLAYLEHTRRKGRAAVSALNEGRLRERCRFPWLDLSMHELMLYNMRHIQHHAAQLNLLLRQVTDSAPGWVKTAKDRR
jgi:hypothetical protein